MVNYVSAIVCSCSSWDPGSSSARALSGNPPHAALFLVRVFVLDLFVRVRHPAGRGWERAVFFRLGKLSGVNGSRPRSWSSRSWTGYGLIDTACRRWRSRASRSSPRDNVPVSIDGVLFFRVAEAALAVTRVQDFRFAVLQYARTSLRDVVGQMTLDELLSEREQIEATIGSHVEKDTRAWGLHVESIRMEDIDMPES
jgi:regulator of protease activity HflC (stomatin/prohibitin superfamily)